MCVCASIPCNCRFAPLFLKLLSVPDISRNIPVRFPDGPMMSHLSLGVTRRRERLLAMASNLPPMASTLIAMASTRIAMASNLLAAASTRIAMASNLSVQNLGSFGL